MILKLDTGPMVCKSFVCMHSDVLQALERYPAFLGRLGNADAVGKALARLESLMAMTMAQVHIDWKNDFPECNPGDDEMSLLCQVHAAMTRLLAVAEEKLGLRSVASKRRREHLAEDISRIVRSGPNGIPLLFINLCHLTGRHYEGVDWVVVQGSRIVANPIPADPDLWFGEITEYGSARACEDFQVALAGSDAESADSLSSGSDASASSETYPHAATSESSFHRDGDDERRDAQGEGQASRPSDEPQDRAERCMTEKSLAASEVTVTDDAVSGERAVSSESADYFPDGKSVEDMDHRLGCHREVDGGEIVHWAVRPECDGSTYRGQLFKGRRHGEGTLEKPSGDFYIGQWRFGMRNGTGKEVVDGLTMYDGEWKDDMRHGQGTGLDTSTESDAHTPGANETCLEVTGEDAEASKVSRSICRAAADCYYAGQWERGKRHGAGKRFVNGAIVYDGEWEEDIQHGKGRLFEGGKELYNGRWELGQKHGRGVETLDDGSWYEGMFANGLRDGKGIWQVADGSESYEGEWRRGQRHGQGKAKENQEEYDGGFQNGDKHGYGVLTAGDGSSYEGNWERGRRHGRGKAKTNEEEYEGTFEHDKRHGHGVLTNFSRGFVYEGLFKNGCRDGKGEFRVLQLQQKPR